MLNPFPFILIFSFCSQMPVLLFSFVILFLYFLVYFIPSAMSLHIWHGICLSYLLILQVCPCNVLCLCLYISMKHVRINNYEMYYFCFPLLMFSFSFSLHINKFPIMICDIVVEQMLVHFYTECCLCVSVSEKH